MKTAEGAPIIAQNASISLITAVPGSFKSARLVDWIMGAVAAGEVVFVSNVSGIRVPGIIPFDDPREWIKDGKPQLPPGSVLVVDEAQKFFRTRASGSPPSYITEMETIRHHGIRLVLVTQQPNYLDIHIRGLVGRHEHLVRKDGASSATVYAKNGCMDEVRDHKRVAKMADDKHIYSPRKIVREMYDSAVIHTVKYVMPQKLRTAIKVLPICAVICVGVWWSVFAGADDQIAKAKPAASSPRSVAAASGLAASGSADGAGSPAITAEALATSMVPRIPGALWSAPAFDGRPIVSEPRSVCMSSVDSCTCKTEQGTLLNEEESVCRFKAVNGESYNPHKQPDRQGEKRTGDTIAPPETAVAVSPVVTSGQAWIGDAPKPIAGGGR